jgi:hypothetical protein
MRRRITTLAFLLVAGMGVFGPVGAAPDPGLAPEVARDYLEAVRARGFSAEAEFMHPEELARFQALVLPVLEADEAHGRRALLNATFGRDASLLDARLADPADFMTRFARVMAVRIPDQPVGFDELQVLGTVREGEKAHVLVRLRTVTDAASLEELEVVSLMPHQDEWRLMLGHRLRKAALEMGPEAEHRPAPRLVPRVSAPAPARPGLEPAAPIR